MPTTLVHSTLAHAIVIGVLHRHLPIPLRAVLPHTLVHNTLTDTIVIDVLHRHLPIPLRAVPPLTARGGLD